MEQQDRLVAALGRCTPEEARVVWAALAAALENAETDETREDGDPHPEAALLRSVVERLDAAVAAATLPGCCKYHALGGALALGCFDG
jgi:hypothetical protein